jgi:hypothetical protein
VTWRGLGWVVTWLAACVLLVGGIIDGAKGTRAAEQLVCRAECSIAAEELAA